MSLYGQCVSCRKYKLFVKQRSYTVPYIHGTITSDKNLCLKCFDRIKFITLGIPTSRFKRLANWIKSTIMKLI